jgi:hypothetical protein
VDEGRTTEKQGREVIRPTPVVVKAYEFREVPVGGKAQRIVETPSEVLARGQYQKKHHLVHMHFCFRRFEKHPPNQEAIERSNMHHTSITSPQGIHLHLAAQLMIDLVHGASCRP